MKHLVPFIHRPLDEARLHDGTLAAHRVRGRWVPEPLDEFDEIDLALPLDADRDLVVVIAVENGNMERILVGWAPSGDDDADQRPFDEAGLAAVFEEMGGALVALLQAMSLESRGG